MLVPSGQHSDSVFHILNTIVCYKILNRAPCAIQKELVVYFMFYLMLSKTAASSNHGGKVGVTDLERQCQVSGVDFPK